MGTISPTHPSGVLRDTSRGMICFAMSSKRLFLATRVAKVVDSGWPHGGASRTPPPLRGRCQHNRDKRRKIDRRLSEDIFEQLYYLVKSQHGKDPQ
jgi:hypothetical protein